MIPEGCHTIILHRNVYQLHSVEYLELLSRYTDYVTAYRKSKSPEDDDYMNLMNLSNDFDNYAEWVKRSFKPLNIPSDNFDLPIYLNESTEDLPF